MFENKQNSLQDKCCRWKMDKNMQKLDKKVPSPFGSRILSNQLLSLVLLISLWVFGKFLVPLKFLMTVFLDNGIGPKLQKAEPLCFQTLNSAPCQSLRNPRPFLSLHPHPPLHLR